jgi:hypothetical protein
MRRTKLGAALASLAVTTGTAAVVSAAPAQADTPTTVQLTFTDPSDGQQYTGWRALYGTQVATFTTVISDGATTPTVGTATLQRRLPGRSWTDQQTDDNLVDGVTFATPKAQSNASYRVEYSGGTDGGSNTWSPSTSNTVQVITYWKFTHLHAKWHGGLSYTWFGAMAPSVKSHKVTIQVKQGSWKRYKVVRTDSRSHWSVKVQAGHNRWIQYRAVVDGTRTLHKNYSLATFKVTFNRTAAPRSSQTSSRALIQR